MSTFLLACGICKFKTYQSKLYVGHYRLHKNTPNLNFPCGFPKCTRTFRTFSAFQSHVGRNHNVLTAEPRSNSLLFSGYSYSCSVSHCSQKCSTVKELLMHIRQHLKSKTNVVCPFRECGKHFSGVTVNTFKSHVSRFHRNQTGTHIDEN